jgi:anti-sigma B factor antagonist
MSNDTPATFRARADRRPAAVVIVAEGELDIAGAPHLVEALPKGGSDPLVVDLGSVAFMDSSGLRALLQLRQACQGAGRPFAIARPSEPVLRVLELVDLPEELEVLDAPPGEAPVS